MKAIDFYIDIRAEIIEVLSGIENADPSLFFDSTKTNYQIQGELKRVFNKYLDIAYKFGVVVVYQYYGCSNKRHRDVVSFSSDGVRAMGWDNVYTSHKIMMTLDTEKVMVKCPCSRNNPIELNSRQVMLGFKAGMSSEENHAVAEALANIAYAIDCAEEKKPRSGIREHLLIAILILNDAISPEKMSDTINRLMEQRGQ